MFTAFSAALARWEQWSEGSLPSFPGCYMQVFTTVPAALAAGNNRWERGHLALVEGGTPSFPGCYMQA